MKIKPRTFQEVFETLHHICQRFARSRSGVHGLYPVVVGFGEEGVGGVHLENFGFGFRRRHGRFPEGTAGFRSRNFRLHNPSSTLGAMKVTLSAASLVVAARIRALHRRYSFRQAAM